MSTFTHTGTFVVETCCNCGIDFGIPKGFYREVKDDTSKYFYCPNGHSQHYTTSEATRLRRKLDAECAEHRVTASLLGDTNHRLDHANRSRAALRGQVTKIKRRVGKGVCPCCRRQFANLKRHMGNKHPDWSEEVS